MTENCTHKGGNCYEKAPILYTVLYALSVGFYFLNKHLLGVYRAYFEKFQKFDEYVVWLNIAIAATLLLCIARAAVHARLRFGRCALALNIAFLLADTGLCIAAFNGLAFVPDYAVLLWLTEAIGLASLPAARRRTQEGE